IHTDGTQNTLVHKRTMAMEIAGHEFWGLDGETIWYDWQYPKGEDFFLAGYDLKTGKRTAFHMQRNEWSIHFNLTKDLVLFTSNMFGPSYVFGVEVKKAENQAAADVVSTPDLARKFNPKDPPNSKGPVVHQQ